MNQNLSPRNQIHHRRLNLIRNAMRLHQTDLRRQLNMHLNENILTRPPRPQIMNVQNPTMTPRRLANRPPHLLRKLMIQKLIARRANHAPRFISKIKANP